MRILVVDDDQVLGRAIGKVLRGHEVVIEHDPDCAIGRVESGDWFELVLCDLHMPHHSGIEVLDKIRAFYGDDTPTLILMSGDDGVERPAVADMLVTKPFGSAEVCGLVAFAAEQRAQRCVATTTQIPALRSVAG